MWFKKLVAKFRQLDNLDVTMIKKTKILSVNKAFLSVPSVNSATSNQKVLDRIA